MPQYKGKQLIRFKAKSGGKNQSDVDGFYEDSDKQKFFIKKPADKGELFAELFAGLILNEFMSRHLIDELYFPSIISADVIQFDDGSYGLIQPLVSFDELHKIIGTSYSDGSDRDPKKEAFFGPSYYTSITKQDKYFGLSMALMFSLLLGAHSVHSGNIVVLKNNSEKASKQYGRIDWGDAFRYFAHTSNNDNLLYAYENRGWFNTKSITKDYFLNYKNIHGLFPAMAEKARQLQGQINNDLLFDIVSSALTKIPADLIDQSIKDKLAQYMSMDSFKTVTMGSKGNFEAFAREMSVLLGSRLNKISELKDFSAQAAPENLYTSVIDLGPMPLTLGNSISFIESIGILATVLPQVSQYRPLDSSQLDLSKLGQFFNEYLDSIAGLCEKTNVLGHELGSSYNIFEPFHHDHGNKSADLGHAFVAEYTESTVLRRLFSINIKTLNLNRFAAFEKPCASFSLAHKESSWVKIQTVLTRGQDIINILKTIQQAQQFGLDDAVKDNIKLLKDHLSAFQDADSIVKSLFSNTKDSKSLPNKESHFFYPITESSLNKMTGDQLATICLEELYHSEDSPLVDRVLGSDALWHRMEQAFETGVFNGRLDNSLEKIAKLKVLRINTLEKRVEVLVHEGAAKDKLIISLQEELKILKLEKETIQKDTKIKIESLLTQINEKQGLITQLEPANTEFRENNLKLGKQLDEAEKIKSTALSSVKSLTEEVRILKLRVQELQLELKTKSGELVQQIKEKEEQLVHTKETVVDQEKKMKQLDITIQELTHAKSTALESVKSLNQQIQSLTPQIEQLEKELSTRTAELKEKDLELKQSEQARLEREKRTQHLEDALQEITQARSVALESVNALTQQVQSLTPQIEQLQRKLKTKADELIEKDQQINQLKQTDQQHRSQHSELERTIEQLTKANASARASVESRTEEIQKLKLEMVKVQEELNAQLDTLKKQHGIELQKVQQQSLEHNTRFEQQIQQLEKARSTTLTTVKSLSEELARLRLQIEELQSQLSGKEEGASLINLQSKQLVELEKQLHNQNEELADLSLNLSQLSKDNKNLISKIKKLEQEKEQSAKEQEEKIKALSKDKEKLQQQLGSKDQTIVELAQKLKEMSDVAEQYKRKISLLSEQAKTFEQDKLAQAKLKEEINRLQTEIGKEQREKEQIQKILKSSIEAQKNFQTALIDKKDFYFARMERMALILLQIKGIEDKAEELKQRKETAAFNTATQLAGLLRKEVKRYAEDETMDEQIALNTFKTNAKELIIHAKGPLEQHREEWKYILANITLGILLAGVGYAAAVLINKQFTGNYTFFSQTKSGRQLSQLEESIELNNLGISAA